MVARGGHVQTVDAAILKGMLGTPDKFATLVFNGVTFLGHLPLGSTSLGWLLPIVGGTIVLLLLRAGLAGVTLERYLLHKHVILCLHNVDHGGEPNNLGVLLVGVIPRSISHHVVMHLVQLLNDVRRERYILHDPRTFELINEGQHNFGGGSLVRTKKARNEALIGVRLLPGHCMNLLKKGHHTSCQKTDTVLWEDHKTIKLSSFLR